MPSRRTLGILLLAALIALGLGYGFWPKPTLVDVAKVTRGGLEVRLLEEGRTRVRDRYVISAPVAGYARRITLQVGDAVTRGQALVELEPLRAAALDPRSHAEARAQVAAAQASLKAAEEEVQAARADADISKREYDRRRRLCKEECISEEEVERAGAEARRSAARLRSAQFNVEVARSQLEAARMALRFAGAAPGADGDDGRVVLTAPVDGRVLKRLQESEAVVQAGQALLEVGDPGAIEIEVDVLSADAVRISPGTAVRIERWGGSEDLEGRVRRVEPVGFTKVSALGVEEQRVLIIVDITSPPALWQRLGDGYRVEASFLLWQGSDVLQVPASALFRHGEGWAVFVVEDGHARRQAVVVGERNGLRAEIREGLGQGQAVVAHPDNTLEDGLRVEARSQ